MSATITIQSITGVDVELRIAGAGSRSYAFVIDWHIRLLLALAWWLGGTFIMAGSLLYFFGRETDLGTNYKLFVALPALAIYFLYHPVLELAMSGKTPGKRMAGVRVVTRNGDIPGPGALLLRNLFRLIDSLPSFYLVGLITVMFTEHNVRIGDLAAGTLLVIDNSASATTLSRVGTAAPGHRLSPQSFDLVHELLDRWPALDDKTRGAIARSLLEKIDPAAAAELATLSSSDLLARLKLLLQA